MRSAPAIHEMVCYNGEVTHMACVFYRIHSTHPSLLTLNTLSPPNSVLVVAYPSLLVQIVWIQNTWRHCEYYVE